MTSGNNIEETAVQTNIEAAKEIAKHVARPTVLDWKEIKRVARYLAGAPRYVQHYEWQEYDGHMHAYADSDWAGDKVTRKSTAVD